MNTRIVKAKKLSKKQNMKNLETLSYKEMLLNHTPDICFGISFVPHGYQADVWVSKNKGDEYACSSQCRDFGGNNKVEDLTEEFYQELLKMVNKFMENK